MTQLRKVVVGVIVVGLGLLAAPAGAQDANRNASDRWEMSYLFGGAVGREVGSLKTSCTKLAAPFVTSGCDATLDLTDRGTPGGIFTGKGEGELKSFLVTGGVKPQKGLQTGLRLGFDFTPAWQLEFVYTYSQVDLGFNNLNTLLDARTAFETGAFGSTSSTLSPDGSAQGNQQMYLGNLNRHFRADKRVVFYVGGGAGMVKSYNGPRALYTALKEPRFGLTTRNAAFSKVAGSDSGFALDSVGGMKIQAGRHIGFRIEAMNILSFPRMNHQFRTIDVSGQCQAATGANCQTLGDTPGSFVDLSGSLKQNSTFNYFVVTVGTYIRFGGH
jgi:hypothetical protein